MASAALGAKGVAMPARKSCVCATRTARIRTMRTRSMTKIGRSALIGMTIALSRILAPLPPALAYAPRLVLPDVEAPGLRARVDRRGRRVAGADLRRVRRRHIDVPT